MSNFHVICGDALTELRKMPNGSVDCCVTSPPYFRKRDYGVDGQLGQEKTPEEFVSRLCGVFDEVRRVLKKTGTCWINIDDSYAGSWGNQSRKSERGKQRAINGPMIQQFSGYGELSDRTHTGSWVRFHPTIKAKDLCLIPARLAIALQNSGWWVRNDVIWQKPNCMPFPATDRLVVDHEYVFLLSRSERYYFDYESIQEQAKVGWNGSSFTSAQDVATKPNLSMGPRVETDKRRKRTVWTYPVGRADGDHRATFPIKLAETCIVAGCPADGIVLDPFSGEATTGMACLRTGRRYLGIELNPKWVSGAYDRARKHYPIFMEAAPHTSRANSTNVAHPAL